MNVLFIGNSFTYFNEMPKMLEQMGKYNGKDIYTNQVTYGGYSLVQYINEIEKQLEVEEKMNECKWDYIVLQDQSRKPLDDMNEFLNSIKQLNERITKLGAKTILYSTWAYRDHSKMLHYTGKTYNEFYEVLRSGYLKAQKMFDTLLAPVGSIFKTLHDEQPDINLYTEDDFHPNLNGSYIAANCFYKIIFEEHNNSYKPMEMDEYLAKVLRDYVNEKK